MTFIDPLRMTHDEAMEFVDDILLYKVDKISANEHDFLDSLTESKWPTITEAQEAWLKSIFDRVMR
jgi:hypothetical protein